MQAKSTKNQSKEVFWRWRILKGREACGKDGEDDARRLVAPFNGPRRSDFRFGASVGKFKISNTRAAAPSSLALVRLCVHERKFTLLGQENHSSDSGKINKKRKDICRLLSLQIETIIRSLDFDCEHILIRHNLTIPLLFSSVLYNCLLPFQS